MPVISGGSGGGAAFNGGTITEGLTIADPDGTEDQLTITGTGTSNAAKLVNATAAHTSFVVGSGGDFTVSGDNNLAVEFSGTSSSVARLTVDSDATDYAYTQINTNDGLAVQQNGAFNAHIHVDDANFVTVFDAGLTTAGSILTVPQYGGVYPATFTKTSGVASVIDGSSNRHVYTSVTFNPTAGAAATCAVAVSPDGVTFTTLWTETVPAGVALDGTIRMIYCLMPGGWRLRMTTVNAVLGQSVAY